MQWILQDNGEKQFNDPQVQQHDDIHQVLKRQTETRKRSNFCTRIQNSPSDAPLGGNKIVRHILMKQIDRMDKQEYSKNETHVITLTPFLPFNLVYKSMTPILHKSLPRQLNPHPALPGSLPSLLILW